MYRIVLSHMVSHVWNELIGYCYQSEQSTWGYQLEMMMEFFTAHFFPEIYLAFAM